MSCSTNFDPSQIKRFALNADTFDHIINVCIVQPTSVLTNTRIRRAILDQKLNLHEIVSEDDDSKDFVPTRCTLFFDGHVTIVDLDDDTDIQLKCIQDDMFMSRYWIKQVHLWENDSEFMGLVVLSDAFGMTTMINYSKVGNLHISMYRVPHVWEFAPTKFHYSDEFTVHSGILTEVQYAMFQVLLLNKWRPLYFEGHTHVDVTNCIIRCFTEAVQISTIIAQDPLSNISWWKVNRPTCIAATPWEELSIVGFESILMERYGFSKHINLGFVVDTFLVHRSACNTMSFADVFPKYGPTLYTRDDNIDGQFSVFKAVDAGPFSNSDRFMKITYRNKLRSGTDNWAYGKPESATILYSTFRKHYDSELVYRKYYAPETANSCICNAPKPSQIRYLEYVTESMCQGNIQDIIRYGLYDSCDDFREEEIAYLESPGSPVVLEEHAEDRRLEPPLPDIHDGWINEILRPDSDDEDYRDNTWDDIPIDGNWSD